MKRLLHRWSERQAELRPGSRAIVDRGRAISYAELDGLANRIAAGLIEAGCRPGDRVALMPPKSIEAIAGMLGALKAGCVYVPIAPDSPASRAASILNQCEIRVALAAAPSDLALAEAQREGLLEAPLRLGWLSEAQPRQDDLESAFRLEDLSAFSREPRTRTGLESDAAHILFTSGSTGTPKGVVITHANVVAYIDWTLAHFGTSPDDRISQHPPLTFDLSTMDIYSCFAAGAELHLVPPELNLLPHKLASFIRDSKLTQWFSVPSILNHMLRHGAVEQGDFPSLKRVMWCGEKFPVPALIGWMQRLPHARFTNLYGPTEATIASSFHDMPAIPADEKDETPIGRPCAGEELHVLDAQLRSLPAGEIGDLYISGVGLSPGYWKDAEKTRGAFLPNPFDRTAGARIYKTGDLARRGEDGLIYLIGRQDTQIKSRGYRIELGEIETALAAIDELRESAVVAVETGGLEGHAICCGYASKADSGLSPSRIKTRLRKSLPGYMIPSRWKLFERLPLNGSGKIDRRTLRETFAEELHAAA